MSYSSLQSFRRHWIKATTWGFFSLLIMIPISFISLALFHPPQFEGLTYPEMFEELVSINLIEYDFSYYVVEQINHILIYGFAGLVLSQLQYRVLKVFIPNKYVWALITALGLWVILLGDLVVMGLSTGGVEGPFEPLLIALGGGSLIALFQFLYLRRHGVKKGNWVLWWMLGILAGIVSSAILIYTYEFTIMDGLKRALHPLIFLIIDWLSFVLPYFTLIGFFTGLLSAKPLYRALKLAEDSPDINALADAV